MPCLPEPAQPLPIRVRAVRADDAADVAFLADQAPRVAAGAPSWHTEAAIAATARDAILMAVQTQHGTEVILIAVDAAGSRLGFVFAVVTTDPLSGRAQGHISDIVVAPEAQGLGVGQRLLAAAEVWASARGCGSLTLHVFPDNTRARVLYERQGYALEWLRLRKPL